MKSILVAFSLIVTMAACSDGAKRPGRMGSPLPGSLGTALYVALSMDDVAGTYTGVLPCADCPGIETTLVLKGNETYRLETRYQGKDDEASYVEEGSWTLKDDKVKLMGIKDASDTYLVEDGYLVQLDMDGKRIEGALAEQYVLKKK
jgi:uncharacterized lipoprotein NlpE involved in copper resistance